MRFGESSSREQPIENARTFRDVQNGAAGDGISRFFGVFRVVNGWGGWKPSLNGCVRPRQQSAIVGRISSPASRSASEIKTSCVPVNPDAFSSAANAS
jgi:hypothetical protein